MLEQKAVARFHALESATDEIASCRREGEHSVFRLAVVLRRVRDQRLYLARFASFERFLTRGLGLSRDEGLKLARAADLLDEAQMSELGRAKVLVLMGLPRDEVKTFLHETFESRPGTPRSQKTLFGMSEPELASEVASRRKKAAAHDLPVEESPFADRLQDALDRSGKFSAFASIQPGAPQVLQNSSGEILAVRPTLDLLGVDRERAVEILTFLSRSAGQPQRGLPPARRIVRGKRPAAKGTGSSAKKRS